MEFDEYEYLENTVAVPANGNAPPSKSKHGGAEKNDKPYRRSDGDKHQRIIEDDRKSKRTRTEENGMGRSRRDGDRDRYRDRDLEDRERDHRRSSRDGDRDMRERERSRRSCSHSRIEHEREKELLRELESRENRWSICTY